MIRNSGNWRLLVRKGAEALKYDLEKDIDIKRYQVLMEESVSLDGRREIPIDL